MCDVTDSSAVMSSGREWRESLAEFTRAAGDGIRQCLDLADDLKVLS